MDIEENDEVIRELDVYISNELDLYLLQFPLKPIYSDPPDNINNIKFKAVHKLIELEIPYPSSIQSNLDIVKDKSQLYTSTNIKKSSNLAIGVIRNNELHLTNVSDVIQMRPTFKNMNLKSDVYEDMNDNDDEIDIKVEKPLQHVQMKRKESERTQSNRLNSYGHLHSLQESESWIKLNLHEIDSNESNEVIEKLYYQENLT